METHEGPVARHGGVLPNQKAAATSSSCSDTSLWCESWDTSQVTRAWTRKRSSCTAESATDHWCFPSPNLILLSCNTLLARSAPSPPVAVHKRWSWCVSMSASPHSTLPHPVPKPCYRWHHGIFPFLFHRARAGRSNIVTLTDVQPHVFKDMKIKVVSGKNLGCFGGLTVWQLVRNTYGNVCLLVCTINMAIYILSLRNYFMT